MIQYINIIVCALMLSNVMAQKNSTEWIFLKESNNISIYYRSSDSLQYEELKFKTVYKASPDKMVSIISDIENIPNWSYLCTETKLIKKTSSTEWYYYYITDTPWPLDDRDVVLQINVSFDSLYNKTTVNCKNINGLVPEKKNFVRIPRLKSRWEFTPINQELTQLEFYFASDPGGLVPLWLLNSAVSYGPIQTLTTFRSIVEK